MTADALSDDELAEIEARRVALAELAKDTIEDYDKMPKGVPSTKRSPYAD